MADNFSSKETTERLREQSPKEGSLEISYATVAEMWRETAANHGLDEALVICGRYIDMNLKRELSENEQQFCRELFGAMYEATAVKLDPAKLVYPYDFKEADERGAANVYHESRKLNQECASAIGYAINSSCYKTNFYNLRIAAMKIALDYGFPRVNMVLAHIIQRQKYDGRYSSANKRWAQDFEAPEAAFGRAHLNAHPMLIDSFTTHTRQYFQELNAERFALPGREEAGENVHEYDIIRSIAFDDNRGFAIGRAPEAVETFVCWQFTLENGKRDFYWGHYCDSEKAAADNFIARIATHTHGENLREVPLTLAAVSSERETTVTEAVAFSIGDYVLTSPSALIEGVCQITGYADDDYNYPDYLHYFIADFGDDLGTCTVHVSEVLEKVTRE
jgi:hypothetical protein